MTVSELIKALVDYSPTSEVRVKPAVGGRAIAIKGVYGVDASPIGQGRLVVIERAG